MKVRSDGKVFCYCLNERKDPEDCDWCGPDDNDFDSGIYDDYYEEPPLYPAGRLQGMTDQQLYNERDRQHRIHDAAVDRCEEINSPTIETAAARARMVKREMEDRGLVPNAETVELMPVEPEFLDAHGAHA